MSTVVVIGGVGSVGSHISQMFLDRGCHVIAYDLRERAIPFLEPFGDHFTVEVGDVHDLRRLQEVVTSHRPEGIIDTSDVLDPSDPHTTVRWATESTANVLEMGRLHGLKVISIISAAIYGVVPDHDVLITEEMMGRFPVGPGREVDSLSAPLYATTKRLKEAVLQLYSTMYSVDAVAIRISGQFGQAETMPVPFYDYIRAALEDKPYTVPAGGDRTVDNMYAKDTALGVYMAFTAKRPLPYNVFNIGWEYAYPIRECAQVVKRLVPTARIEVGPGELRNYPTKSYDRGALSTARAREVLGYRPQYDLQSTARELIDWYRAHPELLPPYHSIAEELQGQRSQQR